MSGFDFDALRDPEAPIPGTRERAGVDARARQLKSRSRRMSFAVSATAIVAAVAISVGVIASTHDSPPEIAVPGSTTTVLTTPTTVGPSNNDRFIPPTHMENGKVVLPVTQPDGSTFTVRYAPKMHIAELGFAAGINIDWPVNGTQCCSEVVQIAYTNIQRVYGDARPLAVYPGAHGEDVPLYAIPIATVNGGIAPQGPPGPTQELAFQFGPWLARVAASAPEGPQVPTQVPFTEDHLATWARSLTGTVDANGYLVLHADAPLSLGNRFSGGFGSETGGLNYTASNNLSFDSHEVCGHAPTAVSMDPISTPFLSGTLQQGNVQWCVEKVLHVQATGSAGFLTSALHDLEVTPLLPAPARPVASTTTTTAPRVASNGSAESSSFVSPEHGWVLEQSGRIDETTDGGALWHAIGQVALTSDTAVHIRFADSAHGFVFTTEPTGKAPLLATTDGGAHWSTPTTPFSAVSDLAISNGVVYVVGVPKTSSPDFPGFRIWSKPAGGTRWSMDPLVIPVGAGPIPFQYLVFAGGNGWMVNNDRDFISGARLSTTTGRWSKWTPPCTGGAQLTASTGRDLVLACGAPFATSATATTIAFSHDGGDTFGKASVPGTGYVQSGPFSPNADTAFMAAPGGMQGTTDGGASWHLVLPADASQGFVDYGFTTPTQGFVIFGGSGEMIMTHDAGATWQKVMGR